MWAKKNGGTPNGRPITALVALCAALLVTGCGAGRQGSELSTASLRQLNAACAAHNKKAAAEIFRLYDHPRVKRANSARRGVNLEVELFIPILLVDAEAQATAIQSFAASSEERQRLKAIFDAYQAWIERARQDPRKTVIANDLYNEARELAGNYGLAECETSPFEVGPDLGAARARQTG